MLNRMNTKAAALFAMACLWGIAHAAPAAPAKNVNIRQEMIANCVKQGKTAQLGEESVLKKLCTCTIGVQADSLTVGEFWDIQSAAINGKDPRTVKAVLKIQPKLDNCSKGLNLKLPPVPPAPTTK